MFGSEIFPLATDDIPQEDISMAMMHINVRMCKLCGAAVVKSGMGLHINWHNAISYPEVAP
jgi:hypothetical protein